MLNILKRSTSAAAKSSAFDRFVHVLESMDARQPGFLRVLTYHRIDEPARRPWLDPGLISATPEDFEEQMAYLSKHYEVISVRNALTAIKSQNHKYMPPRAVLVTFDDGYEDFEERAWPIIKRYKIPTTLFIPTAYPDHPEYIFWWDDLYHALHSTDEQDSLDTPIGKFILTDRISRNRAYQRLKNYLKTLEHEQTIQAVRELCDELGVQPAANCVLRWNSLRRLNREGLSIGAHTQTHPLLNRISPEEAREEIRGSFDDLRREIGSVLPIFAYPGGGVSQDVADLLKSEGVVLAFTTERGINNMTRMNPLKIQRINVGGRTSLPILRAQLLSWTARFSRLTSRPDAYS